MRRGRPIVDVEAEGAEAKRQRLRDWERWKDRLMSAWGWLFDFFTVAVNVSDVISDAIVAWQFYEQGETLWFGLVLASLLLANVVFAVMLAFVNPTEIKPTFWKYKAPPKFLVFLLVLPFAQLIPVFTWAVIQVKKCSEKKNDSSSDSSERGRFDRTAQWALPESQSRAGDEEMEAVAGTFHAMSRLQQSIKEHMKTHIFFYAETMVESIPQVIIQLLAITFLQQATPIQVFSMAASLVSIVSKGYLFTTSQTMGVMVWKFFCCAADLFGLFYIFATLLERQAPQEAHVLFIPAAPKVLHIINLLFLKWILYLLVVLVAVISFAIAKRRSIWSSLQLSDAHKYVGVFLLGTVVFIPAAITVEMLKCSFGVFLITQNESSYPPVAAFIYYFLNSADSAAERDRRAKHLLRYSAQQESLRQIKQERIRNKTRNPRQFLGTPVGASDAHFLGSRRQYIFENSGAITRQLAFLTADTSSSSSSESCGSDVEAGPRSVVVRGLTKRREKRGGGGSGKAVVDDPKNGKGLAHFPCGLHRRNHRSFQRVAANLNVARPSTRDHWRQFFESRFYLDVTKPVEERTNNTAGEEKGTAILTPATVVSSLPTVTAPPTTTPTDAVLEGPARAHRRRRRPFTVNMLRHVTLSDTPPSRPIQWRQALRNVDAEKVFLIGSACFAVFLYTVGQLFSTVFPLVAFGLYYSHQNLLQHVCFYAYALCLLVVLLLAPHTARFLHFSRLFKQIFVYMHCLHDLPSVHPIVESYYYPSVESLVCDAVMPSKLLPLDLSRLVAGYMKHSDINMDAFSKADFQRLKERHASHYGDT